VELARQAEAFGYSTLFMSDHMGDQLAPLVSLGALASSTDHIRLGSLLLNNDLRNPVVLAKELATLDLLSGGRSEVGLGAGWMESDYESTGIRYDAPSVRIDRFEEAVSIISALLERDEPFSYQGSHYRVHAHHLQPRPRQRPRPPLIIGGGGKRMLSIAGRLADIASINFTLRTGVTGTAARASTSPEATRQKVAWIKAAAGDRFGAIELNCVVPTVIITNDQESALESLSASFALPPADLVHSPAVLVGTFEQMEEELEWRRSEYGISYVSLAESSWLRLGPLVAKMTGR
jgi:probable F420-dependent oxidoreductase